jgi:serine protease inhibitor
MRRQSVAAAAAILLTLANVIAGVDARAVAGPARAIVANDEAKRAGALQVGFALDLYHQLAGDQATGNLFFSPYSIYVALAMTAEGARSETADEMGRVLHLPAEDRRKGAEARVRPWDFTRVHAGLGQIAAELQRGTGEAPEVEARLRWLPTALAAANEAAKQAVARADWAEAKARGRLADSLATEMDTLTAPVKRYEIRVANALWGDTGFRFAADYARTLGLHYGTEGVRAVDFQHAPDGARREINDWVAAQTNQRIHELLSPEQVTSATRLVLANAAWFKGEWAVTFDPRSTRDLPFHTAVGAAARVPLMARWGMGGARYGAFRGDGSTFPTPREVPTSSPEDEDDPSLYPPTGGFQLVELPYKGGEIAMVVLLPRLPGDLRALEARLDDARFRKWLGALEMRAINVFLPRFHIEQGAEMSAPLQALGMRRAFTDPANVRAAQFEGMAADAGDAKSLFVGAVAHKAFLDVHEKGTEAAAATAVEIKATALRQAPTRKFVPTLRADRPFLFLIRDVRSGAILFMGRFERP